MRRAAWMLVAGVGLSLAATGALSGEPGAAGEGAPEPVFPGAAWERRAPAEVGLDGAKLEEFAARVRGQGCVVRDGYLVQSWGDPAEKRDWASAAKPVLSTLLFLAAHEGRLAGVDAPVAGAGWSLSERDRGMTYRHLANMVSGYGRGEAPGAAWAYNDYAISLYAQSLERVFGQPLDAAFRSRLAALRFEDGTFFSSRGGRGVSTTPRDFARLGWLWLHRGRWGDRQLIPSRFFTEHLRPGVPEGLPRTAAGGEDYLKVGTYGGSTDQTPHGPGVYGFNWWFNATAGGRRPWPALPADAFQANGMWNRDTVTVIPSLRMVAAVRGAAMGPFEPGVPAGEANRNLGLLAAAAAAR